MEGLVVKSTGSWYTVITDDGVSVSCKVKGNFRLKGIRSTNPVVVGDRVTIIPGTDGTAFISAISDRKNYIVRKASNLSKQSHILAANLDRACLVVTLRHPETSSTFVDRFLAGAEAYRVPVCLIYNKVDLLFDKDLEVLKEQQGLYQSLGYECLSVSARTGEGIENLKRLVSSGITLFSGHSGVGKSTLMNCLLPGMSLRTAEISSAHDTGMHTTTFSEMFPLPDGGYLIDTPGIKGFGTFDMPREEMSHYFRELFSHSESCRFGVGCTHTHEPGCAVRRAVEAGEISASRYASYLSMLEDEDEGKYRMGY